LADLRRKEVELPTLDRRDEARPKDRSTAEAELRATNGFASLLLRVLPLRIMEPRLPEYLARDPLMPDDFDMTIQANPSKEFFVEMLTKDISLSECIMDLVDNSVHSLIRYNNLDV
jgi:hypothetical protein